MVDNNIGGKILVKEGVGSGSSDDDGNISGSSGISSESNIGKGVRCVWSNDNSDDSSNGRSGSDSGSEK